MKNFAIGDISGLKKTLDKLAQKFGDAFRIIAVGDLIDRGDDSKGVIEFFMKNPQHVAIMGNHEHMFIKCYEEVTKNARNPYNIIYWIYINGGKETLESYGLDVPSIPYTRDDIKNFSREDMKKLIQSREIVYVKSQFSKIPKDHIEFLKSLPTFWENDNYFICHAPISNWKEPKLLDYQAFENNDFLLDHGCLWNRKDPDKPRRTDNKILIYGHQNKDRVLVHTPIYPIGKYVDELDTHIDEKAFAVCIDTVKAGYLTALCLEDKTLHYEVWSK